MASVLGYPWKFATKSATGTAPTAEPVIKANAKPEVAVHDFLNSWLVDQKPELAVAYFAPGAFSCMEIEQGTPLDYGVAKFAMLDGSSAGQRTRWKSRKTFRRQFRRSAFRPQGQSDPPAKRVGIYSL